jgi:hypothetical protein
VGSRHLQRPKTGGTVEMEDIVEGVLKKYTQVN